MSGWITEYRKWQAVIVEHYGSLDKFEDARTVRILIQGAERDEKELIALLNALASIKGDPGYKDFEVDLLATKNAKNELLQWLENKGLPR